MEKIISVTDLVRNAARVAQDVEAEGTIYRITRGGRGSMVLVDEEYFDGWMAALDEMRRPDWQVAWAETGRDIAARRGRSLDTIAKELALEGSSHATSRKPAPRTSPASRKKSRRGAAHPAKRSE